MKKINSYIVEKLRINDNLSLNEKLRIGKSIRVHDKCMNLNDLADKYELNKRLYGKSNDVWFATYTVSNEFKDKTEKNIINKTFMQFEEYEDEIDDLLKLKNTRFRVTIAKTSHGKYPAMFVHYRVGTIASEPLANWCLHDDELSVEITPPNENDFEKVESILTQATEFILEHK